jgi:hypothetical protein
MAKGKSAAGAVTVTQPINPYGAEVGAVADNRPSRKSSLEIFTWISCVCALGQALNTCGRFVFGVVVFCVADALRGSKPSQIRGDSFWLGVVELTYLFLILGVPCSFLAVLLNKKRRPLAVFFLVCNLINLVIYCLDYYVAYQIFSKLQG